MPADSHRSTGAGSAISRWVTRHRVASGFVALAVAAGMTFLLLRVGPMTDDAPTERLVLEETTFNALPGWQADDHAAALASLRESCRIISRLPGERSLRGDPRLALTAGDLHPVCTAMAELGETLSSDQARDFFESGFIPFRVRNDNDDTGLVTGYYEPEIKGSRQKSDQFPAPVLARPPDLVSVELGDFRDSLRGQRIAGRVIGGQLVPFEDRAAIAGGALADRDLELIWLESAIDAFFLEIQGSGRVILAADGEADRVIRLSYAGQNGHPYTAIGRPLIEAGHIPREKMSMAAIRDWLESNPDGAQDMMNRNASYVFFTELPVEHPELGPPGAQSALLTPHRSIAVDRKHHVLGLPFWLELPEASPVDPDGPVHRLMVAQDTGGAIRGPVRADYFAGSGAAAGDMAGAMAEQGRLTVLIPAHLADRVRDIAW